MYMSKQNKICCIYMLKNKVNGKIYIGQTVDYFRRMNEYKNRKSSKEKSSNYTIMQAIEKYGFDNFECSILIKCKKDELTEYEMHFISKYKSYMKKYGYNSFHLKNRRGNKQTLNKSTKSKMSKSHAGLTESSETKRKKSNKVYAIKDNEFIISDSGKLLGDYFGKSKDYIKNCLRQPSSINGYSLYYSDPVKRAEIKNKMLSKRSIRNKKYMELLKYIDNSSVETIEKDFHVKYITYENPK